MLTIDERRCPFGCTYCFRDFTQYSLPPTLSEIEADPSLLDGIDVVYPACDVDLFARPDAFAILERTLAFERVVSISTKAGLSSKAVARISKMNDRLRDVGALLKVGISITTKYETHRLEPKAPGYESRLRTLRALREAAVPTALILRPILLDVPADEHAEIIKEAGVIAGAVLVGDEWVDASTRARRSVPAGAFEDLRHVNWIADMPLWPVRPAAERSQELSRLARSLTLEWFESDLDLIRWLLET